jgi:autotransporter translocation and assembly factor TamB
MIKCYCLISSNWNDLLIMKKNSLSRYLIKFLYACFAIITIISVILLSGVYWLSSDNGQSYVQNLIKEEFSNNVGYKIKANGVSFHFPLNAKISNLSLSDNKGKWLEIKNISINILLNPNIHKHLIVTSFSVDKFAVLRTPEEAKTSSIKSKNNIKVSKEKTEVKQSENNKDIKISINGINIKEIFLASSVVNYSKDIKLSVSGSLKWNNFEQALSFDNVIQLRKIVEYVSPVKVNISGKYLLQDNKSKLSKVVAEINTGKIEVTLPSSLASIPQSKTSQKNSTSVNTGAKQSSSSDSKAIALDVKLKMDNNVYVRGYGLDIVFGGDLRIKGNTNDPQVRGKLSIVDGIFKEFGHSFKLKKADLLFEGKIPPYPYLDVVGSTTELGVEVTATLSGPVMSPSFKIKAPSMKPKDIISQLLFGEDSSQTNSSQNNELTDVLKKIGIKNDSGSNVIKKIESLFNKNKDKDTDTQTSNNDSKDKDASTEDLKKLLEKKLKFKF